MTHWLHDRLREWAAPWALGALGDEERAEFDAHLLICPECAGLAGSLSTVAVGLASASPAEDPPPELRARVLREVAEGRSTPQS